MIRWDLGKIAEYKLMQGDCIELDEHYFDTATKRIEEINAKVVGQ